MVAAEMEAFMTRKLDPIADPEQAPAFTIRKMSGRDPLSVPPWQDYRSAERHPHRTLIWRPFIREEPEA